MIRYLLNKFFGRNYRERCVEYNPYKRCSILKEGERCDGKIISFPNKRGGSDIRVCRKYKRGLENEL